MPTKYEVCAACQGHRWQLLLDSRKQMMVKSCSVCNPKGDKPCGVQLLDDGKFVTLENLHKTIAEQQSYVDTVFTEFQEVAKDDRVYIEGTVLKRQKRDPGSAKDFADYFKTRLCMQLL